MLKGLFDLRGKTALVTGSSRGIGRGIALGLAEYGAHMVLHGSRESEALHEAQSLIGEFDPSVETWIADFGDPGAVETMPKAIDVFVANVSIQERMELHEFDINEARREMEVNWHSTLRMFQIAYPHMKANGWGRLIVVGSVQERRPQPMMVAYAATKGALENMVRNIARQVASEGITVNNLCPGVFATDRNKEALDNPEYAKKVLAAIPMRDYALPEDAAGAAVLLASDAGRYITGSTILIDGGLALPG